MARTRLTKGHLLAGLGALICALVALVAALMEVWVLVVGAAFVLMGEILAVSLMSVHRLSGRVNRASQRVDRHLTAVESRYLKPLAQQSVSASGYGADHLPGSALAGGFGPASSSVHTGGSTPASGSRSVEGSAPSGFVEPLPSPFGSEAEMVRRVALNGAAELRAYILQNRAYSLLNVVAQAAHPSHPSFNVLMETLRHLCAHPKDELARDFVAACDPHIVQDIADILASARHYATAVNDAVATFESVRIVGGTAALSTRSRIVALEALIDSGACGDFGAHAARLGLEGQVPATLSLLRANSLLPAPAEMAGRSAVRWLDAVNAALVGEAMEPIRVESGTRTPFDRLACRAVAGEHTGPVVTVVVPTFEADDRFDTAMVSLVRQTWRNLQIVVVDDATPGGTPAVVHAWQARDPRVEILRRERNCGTYANRNWVVRHVARGEFLTVHDDDDWSHPRKIQRQVEHLLATGEPANMSQRARATEGLLFRRMNNNVEYVQPNFSSLMINVAEIRENIGEWDEVNRSGDGEFIDRIAAWRGKPVAVVGEAPLSFQRVREGSLTSGEVLRGYIDTRRKWYELSYKQWHTRARASGQERPFLLVAGQVRPFAAPADLEVSPRRRGATHRVDAIIAGDFRGAGPEFERLAEEIRTLSEAGWAIALTQLNSPVHSIRTGLNPRFLDLARRDGVIVTSILDSVQSDALVLFDAAALQHLDMRPRSRPSSRILLAVSGETPDGIGGAFDTARAVNTCVEVFGVRPLLHDACDGVAEWIVGGKSPRATGTGGAAAGVGSEEGAVDAAGAARTAGAEIVGRPAHVMEMSGEQC